MFRIIRPWQLFGAVFKQHAAAQRAVGPVAVQKYLLREKGLESILDACDRIWSDWSENGCRLIELRVIQPHMAPLFACHLIVALAQVQPSIDQHAL